MESTSTTSKQNSENRRGFLVVNIPRNRIKFALPKISSSTTSATRTRTTTTQSQSHLLSCQPNQPQVLLSPPPQPPSPSPPIPILPPRQSDLQSFHRQSNLQQQKIGIVVGDSCSLKTV